MSVRILVVDDEPDFELRLRQRFRTQIQNDEWQVSFADHGPAALEVLKADPDIDLVLCDQDMLVTGKLSLLQELAENYPEIRPIIVSSHRELTRIRTAMNQGAFDFLLKPIDFNDLEAIIAKTLHFQDALRRAKRDREQLTFLQRDLQVAARIQQSMLPQTFPPFPTRSDFDLHAAMTPAQAVGGDFYDFYLLPDGRLGVVIGDVSGKGVPAAMFMAMCSTMLRGAARQVPSPAGCLQAVNDQLSLGNTTGMFVTLFYGTLDPRTGELRYAIAGHNPPTLIRADRLESIDGPIGMITGAFEGIPYEEGRILLKPGDCLYLYTDGVTEAHNPVNEMFESERLAAVLNRARGQSSRAICEAVHGAVQSFAQGCPQSDDITGLALSYRGP